MFCVNNYSGIDFNFNNFGDYFESVRGVESINQRLDNYIDCIIANNYVRTCSLMGMSGKKGDNGKVDVSNKAHMNLFFEVCQMFFKLSVSINFLSYLNLLKDYPYDKFKDFIDILKLSGDDICKNPKNTSLEEIRQELNNAYDYLEYIYGYFSEDSNRSEIKNKISSFIESSKESVNFLDSVQLFSYFVLCTNEENQENLQTRIKNVLSGDDNFKSFWEN